MTYFFVDYENVKEDGLDFLPRVKKEDKIVIFYSENTPKVKWELISILFTKKLDVQITKAVVGHKDSLDHQLASFLGMEMTKNKEDDFCIVSSDMAFCDVVTFWKKRKYKIYRVTQLSEYFRIKNEENTRHRS